MRDKTYCGSDIVELREAMLEERTLHRRSSKLYYGGPHSSKMQRHMLDLTTSVKEWESHHDEMNLLFSQCELCKNSRNGRSNSLGRSTPHLSIQRPCISLPQLITLYGGLRNQLSSISWPIFLLGSFLKILSLGLYVLGVWPVIREAILSVVQ
jgi:hypothetical protein